MIKTPVMIKMLRFIFTLKEEGENKIHEQYFYTNYISAWSEIGKFTSRIDQENSLFLPFSICMFDV